MEIKKAKGAYYILLKLDPEARRYLRDFNKYESKATLNEPRDFESDAIFKKEKI
jgi:hypothetical protein